MEDNLAHELEEDVMLEQSQYTQPHQHPYIEGAPSIEPIPQAEPISKGLTKFEVALISLISIVVFALVLLNVYSDFYLSSASRSVQDVSTQIQSTEVEIENLKQHVHELSRYDRVNDIAGKYGLELHEENIRNLSPVE